MVPPEVPQAYATVSGWRKHKERYSIKKHNGNASFWGAWGSAESKDVGRHLWSKSLQLHFSLWGDSSSGRCGPKSLQMRNWQNPEQAPSPAFICKSDPAKIGPSITSSNIFNFHFVLCCTLYNITGGAESCNLKLHPRYSHFHPLHLMKKLVLTWWRNPQTKYLSWRIKQDGKNKVNCKG